MTRGIKIAIDGPASSGKSTIAKRIAKKLNYVYLDTGAMYRCVALAALTKNISSTDQAALADLLEHINIGFELKNNHQMVLLNDENVTDKIRADDVSQYVSAYAAQEIVRTALVAKQQQIAGRSNGIVMDGRDIGTVVLPTAEVKIFLTANVKERAKRRYAENQAKGLSDLSLEALETEINRRDIHDSNREISPLKAAEDAIHIDTSQLTIEQVEEAILKIITGKLKS